MGAVRDSIEGILQEAGMPDHIIEYFDIIGEGIDVDDVEFRHNASDWACVMTTEDNLMARLRVPKDCPPEILTKELRDKLIAGILDEFNHQRARRKALKEFNQPEPEVPQARRLN